MFRYILAIAFLGISTIVHAQAQGYVDAINQQAQRDLLNAQTQAINAWTNCVKANGGDACGPMPQPRQYQPQQYQPQQQPIGGVTANLVGVCRTGRSVTGQFIYIGTYQYGGNHFERAFTIWCPPYTEVR